jgi:hypothetical protein
MAGESKTLGRLTCAAKKSGLCTPKVPHITRPPGNRLVNSFIHDWTRPLLKQSNMPPSCQVTGMFQQGSFYRETWLPRDFFDVEM